VSARLARARKIAAAMPGVAVTEKPGAGRAPGGVTFGRGKNAAAVPVSFAPGRFDAMSDASVAAELSEKWKV
jgi:hypothetical protein